MKAAKPLIDLKEVSFRYGDDNQPVLKPTNLIVESGEFVAIVGPSGSGKSTLLNILGLLDSPGGGEYFLGGARTSDLSDARRASLRAHHIGFVFQSFHLLMHRTCLENVELSMVYRGTPKHTRSSIASGALRAVGLSGRLNSFPSHMSGGEQQRVAIARAAAATPSLLLCDEPTGNLDSANTDAILQLLEDLNRSGLTIVMITHDFEVAARAARILRIFDGNVLEQRNGT